MAFGLAMGGAVSITVTLVICLWEWIENPGGIFHNSDGTNWQFVFDTAASWMVPTFLYSVVAASSAHLAWTGIASLVKKILSKDDSGAV